jgi:CRISPR-associated protein Cmr2
MTNWKYKLLAFLHDPPEKAYDYSPEHGKRAQHYADRVDLNLAEWKEKLADYTAAAADRFIFPATKRKEGDRWVDTGVPGLGGGVQIVHPLTGLKVEDRFPGEDEALGFCRDGFPDFSDIDDPQLRFWLIWRLWRHYTVEQPKAKQFALALASLPADTRIPDGTIWHHDAVVSALEGVRDAEGRFAPAFLLFQIGPVQEFIAQARSTRDAWSGSYLISWMMAHAMKLLAEKLGPDCVIYPSLRGQPLYDWLEQEKLKRAFHTSTDGARSKSFWEVAEYEKRFGQEFALTPNLPNRFLAVVPTDFDTKQLDTVFNADGWNSEKPDAELSEWARIVRACWRFLPKVGTPESAERLWDFQVRHFWQTTWQLWRWQEVAPAMEAFRTIPLGEDSPLHAGRDVALGIPNPHKDTRCYTPDLNEIENPGWAWSAHYQLLAHRLHARRQTRDFAAWQSAGKPGHKDHFSGKEEVIATSDWLKAARKNGTLRHLFRHDDELGAVNLIKRVWHTAYLEKERGFKREAFRFDSVLSIAAAPWREKVLGKMGNDEGACSALLDFQEAVKASAPILDFDLPAASNESEWLTRVDASVFHDSFWNNLDLTGAEEEKLRDAGLASLRALLKAAKTGQPGKYFAVVALDGDQIGKWLSGEKTPAIEKVITDKAVRYFREHIKGRDVEAWLKTNRPLSPSYHLQFSEALANFGLYCARRIVEAHHGQLIYSGGDDVLAMLPAEEAIACAQGLQLAFQGKSAELTAHSEGRYARLFATKVPAGFIQLKDGDRSLGCRLPAEPSWPLLVPGPKATVSVGIAIGHIKEPLQDMIHEARQAEKRAKADPQREVFDRQKNELCWKLNEGWGRDALAITLFKRSGELIRWGAKFDSSAFALLNELRAHYRRPVDDPNREMPISGKFPYRIAELLSRYETSTPLADGLRAIAAKELAWAISQQTWKDEEAERSGSLFRRGPFEQCCLAYLNELLAFRWKRKPDDAEQTSAARPLREFLNLFLTEAFIARQGD